MHIDSYRFGEMLVNGRSFTSDLIIFGDRIDDQWWRESSHVIMLGDIEDVMKSKPDVLIVGRGKLGALKIPEKTAQAIEGAGIQLVHARTEEAIEVYNQIASTGKNVVGAFHLTC